MNTIELIKKIWKTGVVTLVVSTMLLGGLFLNLRNASATGAHLTLLYLGINNTTGGSWTHSVNVSEGQVVKFYAEIHNDVIGTTANNVKIKATLPNTTGTSTATVSSDNTNTVSDNVSINVTGGHLEYVPGSTAMTWDTNGDGTFEYNGTALPDGIIGNGIVLGNQKGCNEYIIQLSFKAKVVKDQQASPTPTPVASPTPPPAGGNNQQQQQNQEQTQNNNQSVNVTNTNNNTVNVPQVAGVSTIAKQPETGVSVLGMASMFGAGPVGLALSRFGKGRVLKGKKEENLAEIANDLVQNRSGKSKDA